MCEKLIWEFLTYRDIIYRIILIYFHIPIFTIPKKKTTKTLESKSQLQYDNKIWIQKEKKLIVENLGWGKHLTLSRTEASNERSLRWLLLMVNLLVCQVKFKPSYNLCVAPFQCNPLSPFSLYVKQGKPLTDLKWRFIYVIKTGQISMNYREIILTTFFFSLISIEIKSL